MKKNIALLISIVFMSACSPSKSSTNSTAAISKEVTVATESTSSAHTQANQIANTSSATTPAPMNGTKTKEELDSKGIVTELKAAGYKLTGVIHYTEETDVNNLLGRPHGYTSKSNFYLPGDKKIEEDGPHNTIEVFENEEDASSRAKYIEEVTSSFPALTQYIYLNGKYLLRIDKQTSPAKAKEIEESFNQLVGK